MAKKEENFINYYLKITSLLILVVVVTVNRYIFSKIFVLIFLRNLNFQICFYVILSKENDEGKAKSKNYSYLMISVSVWLYILSSSVQLLVFLIAHIELINSKCSWELVCLRTTYWRMQELIEYSIHITVRFESVCYSDRIQALEKIISPLSPILIICLNHLSGQISVKKSHVASYPADLFSFDSSIVQYWLQNQIADSESSNIYFHSAMIYLSLSWLCFAI